MCGKMVANVCVLPPSVATSLSIFSPREEALPRSSSPSRPCCSCPLLLPPAPALRRSSAAAAPRTSWRASRPPRRGPAGRRGMRRGAKSAPIASVRNLLLLAGALTLVVPWTRQRSAESFAAGLGKASKTANCPGAPRIQGVHGVCTGALGIRWNKSKSCQRIVGQRVLQTAYTTEMTRKTRIQLARCPVQLRTTPCPASLWEETFPSSRRFPRRRGSQARSSSLWT